MFFDTQDSQEDIRELKDEVILSRSIRKPQMFVHLVERYEDAFLRKAYGVLKNKEACEDAVQETFTKIYLNADRFRKVEGARFSSWGYKILMNTCFTYYRKRSRKWDNIAQVDPEWYETMADKRDTFAENEFTDLVASVMTRMPAHLSRVLGMHFLEGKSHREIAEVEGSTEGAIKTRVYRAKKTFRDISESINVV